MQNFVVLRRWARELVVRPRTEAAAERKVVNESIQFWRLELPLIFAGTRELCRAQWHKTDASMINKSDVRLPACTTKKKSLQDCFPGSQFYGFASTGAKQQLCTWRTLFASSPSVAAWLWTAMMERFQWLEHVRFYYSTGGLPGVVWTWCVSPWVFNNQQSFSLHMFSVWNQVVPDTNVCSRLRPNLSKPWRNWSKNVPAMYERHLPVLLWCKHYSCIYCTIHLHCTWRTFISLRKGTSQKNIEPLVGARD